MSQKLNTDTRRLVEALSPPTDRRLMPDLQFLEVDCLKPSVANPRVPDHVEDQLWPF